MSGSASEPEDTSSRKEIGETDGFHYLALRALLELSEAAVRAASEEETQGNKSDEQIYEFALVRRNYSKRELMEMKRVLAGRLGAVERVLQKLYPSG